MELRNRKQYTLVSTVDPVTVPDNEPLKFITMRTSPYWGRVYYKGTVNKHMEKHGYGTLYYENGTKEYEGGWKNDAWNGRGIRYYKNGTKEYEGELKDGKYHGTGTSYHQNGYKDYEGEWVDGKRHGRGISYHWGTSYHFHGKKDYDGEWKDDQIPWYRYKLLYKRY